MCVAKQARIKRRLAFWWRLQSVGTRLSVIGTDVGKLESAATSDADDRKIWQVDLYEKLSRREDSLVLHIRELANCAES